KTTSLLFYCKSVDSVGAEIIGNKIPLPIGHMTPRNDVQTAVLRLSGIQSPDNPLRSRCCDKSSSGKSVVDPFAPCPIGQERLSPTVKLQAPGIDQASGIDFQFTGFRP